MLDHLDQVCVDLSNLHSYIRCARSSSSCVCRCDIWCTICAVSIDPRKRLLEHADQIVRDRQYNLCHAYAIMLRIISTLKATDHEWAALFSITLRRRTRDGNRTFRQPNFSTDFFTRRDTSRGSGWARVTRTDPIRPVRFENFLPRPVRV